MNTEYLQNALTHKKTMSVTYFRLIFFSIVFMIFMLLKSYYLLIIAVAVAVFGGTGVFSGLTPVQELLFKQGGFVVLSQSTKHCPIRTALAFPTGEEEKSGNNNCFSPVLQLLTCLDMLSEMCPFIISLLLTYCNGGRIIDV